MREKAVNLDRDLPLAKIDRVTFYKIDEVATDLICCEISVDKATWTFHEERSDWDRLLGHLASLPGFDSDWFAKTSQPPFERCEVVAFRR